jgi:hypothetical protein
MLAAKPALALCLQSTRPVAWVADWVVGILSIDLHSGNDRACSAGRRVNFDTRGQRSGDRGAVLFDLGARPDWRI